MSVAAAIAPATSALAAAAFYAASPHCLWLSLRRWRRWSMACAVMLCMLSIGVWITVLGIGAGLCAMLCTCMLGMAVLPWLALSTASRGTAAAAERD